jgi:3-isopropylmalate dehydratase small subunit
VAADPDSSYSNVFELNAGEFVNMVSRPGKPHDAVPVEKAAGQKIDSAFIGSCTNGRMEDLRMAAGILKDRKVAPGVVLKIVPSTDRIWNLCLEEGLLAIFKEARAMVSNAGCAGCATGQVGQNGPGEITISSGNRNFTGKQGKGDVWLASPAVIAASAIAGYITTPDKIPVEPVILISPGKRIPGPVSKGDNEKVKSEKVLEKPVVVTGNAWFINKDNIDTDMIYHNRHLAITDIREMGKYAFGNLPGYEDFARKAGQGDIIVTGKNFGSGSSRQQAVDCFRALGIQCIIAESFGAIYERNAINAAFPILVTGKASELDLRSGDMLQVDFRTGEIINVRNNKKIHALAFPEVQMDIYKKGGLL